MFDKQRSLEAWRPATPVYTMFALQELKGLASMQAEETKKEAQALRSELSVLKEAQQSSSQAVAAELASLRGQLLPSSTEQVRCCPSTSWHARPAHCKDLEVV